MASDILYAGSGKWVFAPASKARSGIPPCGERQLVIEWAFHAARKYSPYAGSDNVESWFCHRNIPGIPPCGERQLGRRGGQRHRQRVSPMRGVITGFRNASLRYTFGIPYAGSDNQIFLAERVCGYAASPLRGERQGKPMHCCRHEYSPHVGSGNICGRLR